MKTKLFTTIIVLLLLFEATAQSKKSNLPSNTIPGNIPADWYSGAAALIREKEYSFQPGPDKNELRVVNRANRLYFSISPGGYAVSNLRYNTGETGWKVNFLVKGIGRTNTSNSFPAADLIIKQPTTASYSSSLADVEYINDTRGLRQNFIIKQKKEGEGPLKIKLQVATGLNIELRAGNKLVFHTKGDPTDVKLIYDDLIVWDADHKPLQARMEAGNDNSLALVIEDNNAAYPITVDPLNHAPEWTTSADGVLPGLLTDLQLQVDAIYGYSVAGLGDVNGDGFDDVAVGAPGAIDIIAGNTIVAAAGAVFVYFGSAAGLPLTPSKVLRATTPIANALFGFSIAGGNVSGDSRNDIIIGAPGESYTANAGGTPSTATVTAGKVYVFRGEDLSAAGNPSPFLAVFLNGSSFFSNGILGLIGSNVSINALFGFSVGATEDMNGDGLGEVIVGSPGYAAASLLPLLPVRTGTALVYYSGNLASNTPTQLVGPTAGILGIPLLTNGLLFGFSVDGLGDYNKDGNPDVVVGAPAGITLVPPTNLLGGSAYIYTGNGAGVNTAFYAHLRATPSLIGTIANLFGYSVRGVRDAGGARNGNVLVGAPSGNVLSNILNGLRLKAGSVNVFTSTVAAPDPLGEIPDQVLSSPRGTSLLAILAGQNLSVSALFGASIDNMLDVNCDGINDIIVGEPLSTGVGIINVNAVGGAADIFLGKADGTYTTTPFWTLENNTDFPFGINAGSLLGYSVAGARYVKGRSEGVRALVGAPGAMLDFSTGIFNLGATFGTLFGFVAGDNGVGKAYLFGFVSCPDNDKDGIDDAIDVDDDNDGIPDRYEFATGKNSAFTPASDPSGDDDGDGVPNYKDADNAQGGGLNSYGICINYDRDGDGVPNHFDLDSDNDGLQDVIEAGGHDANGDGRLDCSGACDADGDGLLAPVDINDASQANYAASSNISKEAISPNTYVFGNSFYNGVLDTDHDTVPDFLDIDSDNDGIYDIIETGGADTNGDGRVDFTEPFGNSDTDNDGWINSYDADTNNDGDVTDTGEGTQKALIISNSAVADGIADTWTDGPAPDKFPVDFDSDVLPNYRDLESDSDGINDVLEAGGSDPDGNGIIGTGASNAALVNGDGYATALTSPLISTDADINGDGRPEDDNDPEWSPYFNGGGATPYGGSSTSPLNFRPDQDSDTRPNFLDLDSDNDGINDILENTGGTVTYDTNNDGLIDVPLRTDADFDGIADGAGDGALGVYGDGVNVAPINSDGDNVPDYLDLDSDNDGVFDVVEVGTPATDGNGDGIVDCNPPISYAACDPDLDGILAQVDGQPAVIGDAPIAGQPNNPPNSDTGPCADALPDYRDIDSQNPCNGNQQDIDGTIYPDANNDGIIDGTDTDFDGIINPVVSPGFPDNNQVFGGNTAQGSPLPVTLIDFKVRQQQQTVEVRWTTAQEINLSHFEVMRSNDGVNYITIGSVLATGGVNGAGYLFIDPAPLKGYNYYRLKMIDNDAQFKYSPIGLVKLADANAVLVSIAPNPVQNEYRIRLAGLEKGEYRIELINSMGQLQLVKKITITEYDHVENMTRGNNLASGIYWLNVINDKTNRNITTLRVYMNNQ